MNTAAMLDKAQQLTFRQEFTDAAGAVNRAFLLTCMNEERRSLLHSNDITSFYQYLENVIVTSGVIDLLNLNIKAVKTVFYKETTEEAKLIKLDSRDDAVALYSDVTKTGTPYHYFVEGLNLYILPRHTTGQINLVAEVWPPDLTDSEFNTDITTVEIPDILYALAAARYLGYKDDPDRSKLLYSIAQDRFQQYMLDLQNKASYDVYPSPKGYF